MAGVQNYPDFTSTREERGFVIVSKDSPTISKMILVTRNTCRARARREKLGCIERLQRNTRNRMEG